MEWLKGNFEWLEKQNIAMVEKLNSLEIDGAVAVEHVKNGTSVLTIQHDGRKWFLNSRLDPQMAAELYVQRYPIRKFGTYFIFGLSDGRHIREFLKQCDDTNHVIVCEPSAAVFCAACANFELADILADERLSLCVPGITDDVETIMRYTLQYTDLMVIEFCILPGYDILYHEECENFMETILDRLQDEIVRKSTRLSFDRMVPRHTLYNMKHMIGCRNIFQIIQAMQGMDVSDIPAVIVSAGPSLDKNIHELKKAEGKALIVVVDAALRTVLRAGIRPDIVCTIDPESPDRFFENLDLKDISWCCDRVTRPWIMEHFGEKVYYYGFFEQYWNEILDENTDYPFPDIPSGGCVSAIAFSLACYLGFRRLVLIGQDMAFTGGISHTAGIEGAFGDNDEYIQSRHLIQVEGLDGTMLETDFQMWYYKKWFEKAIRANRDLLEVIDATEGGAKIDGAEIATLRDVVENYCKKPFVFAEIEKNIGSAYSEEKQTKLLHALKEMKPLTLALQEQIKKGIRLQEQILQGLGEKKLQPFQMKTELGEMLENNDCLEHMPVFDMMVSYAQKEEYELGDRIYEKEEMPIEELVERNLTLYQGYEKAVEMLLEDIEEYIIQ